ncbi:MAG: SurA N-terminal domain-containing protein [Desulfobulbaceae bacterium]|nr:SurA N-terminal domain-containing protein [Desulfobulbaceae bacterium]HIJ79417.1 peptidylprolyl isomerase [Deltaproteobacteria bacterium]
MNRSFKKIFSFAITFALVSFLFFANSAQCEIIDRIIAIVNDDVITFSDLNKEGAPIFLRIMQQAPPEQVEMTLLKAREEILSGLIDKMIIEQHAAKLGISISDQELDQAVANLIAGNRMTPEQFRQQLTAMGTSEAEYRGVIRHQILQQKLVDYEIRSRVVVTDEKIKEYYDKNYAQKQQHDAYHILQIGLTWESDSPAAKEQAYRKAEEIRKQAISGQDFRELARRYSILPSAADGGDIGVFKENEMASYMKMTIPNMEPGQISDIIETPAGYQFYKLLSNQGNIALLSSYEQVKDEIKDKLRNETMNSQFQKWVLEIRNQAYIKKML